MTTARYGGRLSATTGWPEGNMSLKNPVTTPGIDPGTVRLVAQRFNHYATPGPQPIDTPDYYRSRQREFYVV